MGSSHTPFPLDQPCLVALTPKPNPCKTPINAPFREGCNDGRLMLQRCADADCRRYVHYPRACFPHCGGGDLDWVEASGKGRVVSWTMVHRPHYAGFGPEAPYVFLAVALAEGPLMYSRLAGTAPEDLVDRSVRAVFVDHGPDRKVPFSETGTTDAAVSITKRAPSRARRASSSR